jgi:hypothetical protein
MSSIDVSSPGLSEGVGVHYQAIDAPYNLILHNFFISLFVEDIFYSLTLAFVKLSVLAFYWRIFQFTSIRLPIKIMATVVISWLIARVWLIRSFVII